MPIDLPQAKPRSAPRRWTPARILVVAALLWIARSSLAVARVCMWLVNWFDRI